MRRRRGVRGLVLHVIAGLVVLVTTAMMIGGAQPAAAGVPSWPGIPCTGAIDTAVVAHYTVEVNLTLVGRLECTPAKGQVATYGYARYLADYPIGMLQASDLRSHDGTATLRFTETRNVAGPAEVAYCVVTTETTRVGCVKVIHDGPGHQPLVEPLPADAPLVSVPARVVGDEAYTNPGCGGCW